MRLVLFFFYISLSTFSQNINDDLREIIKSTIVEKANNYYNFYQEEKSKVKNTNNWKIYIASFKNRIENTYIIDEDGNPKYLDVQSKINFKYLNIYEKRNRKILRKGIEAWKVLYKLKGSLLTVTIIDFTIRYRDGIYHFINKGGIEAKYEYSCEENKWVKISYN